MKPPILSALLVFAAVSANAQYTYQDAKNKDMLRPALRNSVKARKEIVIPQVDGYNAPSSIDAPSVRFLA